MMKAILLVLFIFLSACTASVIPNDTIEADKPVTNEVDINVTESDELDEVILRTMFVSLEDLPKVLLPKIATHPRPVFADDIRGRNLEEYQEIIFIYQNKDQLQWMSYSVDFPEVPIYYYLVEFKNNQVFVYLNPGPVVRQADLFEALSGIDVSTEGLFPLAFDFPIFERNYLIDEFQSIAVVTNALSEGEHVDFLPRDRHVVFNDSVKALEQEFDAYLFMYEQNNDLIYPRTNFGKVLRAGEIIGFEENGKTIILMRFSSDRRPELTKLQSNVFSLRGRMNIDEYEQLNQGLIYTAFGIFPDPNRVIDNQNVNFSPLDICRIRTRARHNNGQRTGFPYEPHITKDRGTVRIAVIALDFPDFPGDPEAIEIIKEDIMRTEEWSRFMTGGVMTYEIVFVEEWLRLPLGVDYYPTYGSAFENERQPLQAAYQQAFDVADSYVDFSTIDFTYFFFPYESLLYKPTVLYGVVNLRTTRAGQIQMAIYGNENKWTYIENRIYTHLIHEVLHFQGLVGHGPCHHCDLGVMTRDGGYTLAILSWEGFFANWYGENDVHCLTKENVGDGVEIQLDSLDQLGAAPGFKNVMIPLSTSEIMIIEYRTDGPHSTLPENYHGIIIYIVNTSKISIYPSEEFVRTKTDPSSYWFILMNKNDWHIFYPGQSTEYNGVRIEIVDKNIVKLSLS